MDPLMQCFEIGDTRLRIKSPDSEMFLRPRPIGYYPKFLNGFLIVALVTIDNAKAPMDLAIRRHPVELECLRICSSGRGGERRPAEIRNRFSSSRNRSIPDCGGPVALPLQIYKGH